MQKTRAPKKRLFYYHSQEMAVITHALFWIMTQSFKGKVTKEMLYQLLRKYEEEMLEAYLTEDDCFTELLHNCNILFEGIPLVLLGSIDGSDKTTRQFIAIAVVAAGFANDMSEEKCYELLDDMDFCYNKVKCLKIEQMLPRLKKMVAEEMESMSNG